MATADSTDPTAAPAGGERRREHTRLVEGGLVPALVLVGLGAIFLLQNLGALPALANWWALFLLLPAAGAAGAAWSLYRGAGDRLTPAARRSALGAAAFTAVAAMLLFGLNWGLVWPVFLIFIGLEALAGRGDTPAPDRG